MMRMKPAISQTREMSMGAAEVLVLGVHPTTSVTPVPGLLVPPRNPLRDEHGLRLSLAPDGHARAARLNGWGFMLSDRARPWTSQPPASARRTSRPPG